MRRFQGWRVCLALLFTLFCLANVWSPGLAQADGIGGPVTPNPADDDQPVTSSDDDPVLDPESAAALYYLLFLL